MLTISDVKSLCAREPYFDDMKCSLRAISKQPRKMLKETKEVVALARKFNNEVVRPQAARLDRKVQEDPDYLPLEFIEEANRWGLYTLWIPRIFGGKGFNLPSFSYFVEEIASACAAMANLIGVHYLGVADLIKTVIPQTATKRISLMPSGSSLELGDHPVAESIQNLGISDRPFMSVYFPERAGILPSGTVIENGVRPLEGYLGEDRMAAHNFSYPGSEN